MHCELLMRCGSMFFASNDISRLKRRLLTGMPAVIPPTQQWGVNRFRNRNKHKCVLSVVRVLMLSLSCNADCTVQRKQKRGMI